MQLLENTAFEVELQVDGLLYAGVVTGLEPGDPSYRFAYHSADLDQEHPACGQMFELIASADLIGAEMVEDPTMVGGKAWMAMYELDR